MTTVCKFLESLKYEMTVVSCDWVAHLRRDNFSPFFSGPNFRDCQRNISTKDLWSDKAARASMKWLRCPLTWVAHILRLLRMWECPSYFDSHLRGEGRGEEGGEGWGVGRGGWLGGGRNVSMQRSPSKILQGGQEEDTFMQIGAQIL